MSIHTANGNRKWLAVPSVPWSGQLALRTQPAADR